MSFKRNAYQRFAGDSPQNLLFSVFGCVASEWVQFQNIQEVASKFKMVEFLSGSLTLYFFNNLQNQFVYTPSGGPSLPYQTPSTVFIAYKTARRGSHEDAKKYCSKEESRVDGPYEFGSDQDLSKSKKRKIDEIKDLIKSGASDLDIADEYFGLWLRYHKAFATYRMLVSQPRDFKTEVRVYWGKAGVGKSRRASYEAGPRAYRKPRGEWWDRYDGESNVIFDDFYGWIKLDELLRICDMYSHQVPVKGGFINFRPRLIIFTSNVEPLRWYSEDILQGELREAFLRRFDVIEEMTEPWVEPEERVNNDEINNN